MSKMAVTVNAAIIDEKESVKNEVDINEFF